MSQQYGQNINHLNGNGSFQKRSTCTPTKEEISVVRKGREEKFVSNNIW
jgi:hypothetical protein